MLRIAVCDDKPAFLWQIKTVIEGQKIGSEHLQIETFENADSLITAHASNPFHIILLDVIMPLLNGIEAAKEIRQQDKSVKIVFLTSSSEFAVDSYTVKANDYLLKPLNTDRLFHCLTELAEDIRKEAKRIIVKGQNAVHWVEINSIEYIEAQNKRVLLTLCDGRTIAATEPLYTYEEKLLLADGFFKCNRSYIVNIYQIDTYTLKEIKMRSGYRIPISRNRHKEFEAAYFELLFGKAGDR